MAVQTQTPFKEYVANGVTTVFPLEFNCDNSEYLIVSIDGEEAPVGSWSLANDTVTFNTPPVNGVAVTLERNTPYQRTTDYQSYNNSFRPSPVNKDFDLIWWKLQELGYRDQVIWLALVKEISERIEGDENLQNQINTIDEWLTDLQQNVNENTSDISQLVNDLSKEIADRITGDQILKDMFISMIDEAINEGTINALAIIHLDSLEALEGVTNVWDGRTIYIKDLGNYRYDALTTSWIKAFQDADNVKYGDKTQKQINDLLLLGAVSTYVITPSLYTDLSEVLPAIPENSTVIIKNGNYTAAGVQIEKNNYKIEMQDGAKITLKAGSNGIFLRFGKRGPDTDTNSDNLPQHNGTIDYWDENQFSPSIPSYIRHENLGISGGTIVIDNANGVGGNTGIDFYRCNSPVLETTIKWSSKFAFGNAVRVWFCKDLQSNFLKIDDNENSTFTMLYYWSYGLRAGDWDIGKGVDTSMEFKHSVDGYVRTLKARGSDGICKAVNFGYGSINNTIDRLEVRGGSVRLKASEEFDLTRGIVINDLDIENTAAEGLIISHISGLRIGKFRIRAKVPLYFSAMPFYMFSSTRGITPSQSTGEYVFDGNYRTSDVSGSITKYFEKRAYPVLQNASFGQGELIATTTATQVIFSNVSGGVVDMMTSTGKLRRYEEGQITARGYNENWRASFKYEYSAPNAIEDVNFGDMTIKAENNAANISSMVQFTSPLIKCSGTLRTYADKKSLQFIWMFDSNINLNTNRYLTASAGFVVEMDSMVRSTIGGKLLANGRVVNFKGGSPIYYTDGYVDHKLTGRIIRQSVPISTPPIYTNFSSSSNTWKPLFISGLNIYAEDGSSVSADASIITHNLSIPAGVSAKNGAGYVCDQACVTDHNQRFRRIFTDASAETPPPLTPNFIGELAVNTTTNTWWNANSSTTWSKL